MPIAFLTLELHIEAAQSIKDRRQVVRSLKDRLRTSFNVSVAELDAAELWNRATVGVVSHLQFPRLSRRPDEKRRTRRHSHRQQPRRRNRRLLRGIFLDLPLVVRALVVANHGEAVPID